MIDAHVHLFPDPAMGRAWQEAVGFAPERDGTVEDLAGRILKGMSADRAAPSRISSLTASPMTGAVLKPVPENPHRSTNPSGPARPMIARWSGVRPSCPLWAEWNVPSLIAGTPMSLPASAGPTPPSPIPP